MPRFRGVAGSLIADIYAPSSPGGPGVALYLAGFPATLGENKVTQALVDEGYTVVCPHYAGTYDSGGRFTPVTAVQTARRYARAVAEGGVVDAKKDCLAKLPREVVLCVGYSFGAYVAMRAAAALLSLRDVYLFSPALTYGPSDLPSGFVEEGKDFLAYVRRSRPHTYRLGTADVWSRFYAGDMNGAPAQPNSGKVAVRSFVGGEDDAFEIGVLQHHHENIVRRFFPLAASVSLKVVEGGSHSIDTLAPAFAAHRHEAAKWRDGA